MVIDGKKIAQEILKKVEQEVKGLSFQPVFCDVLVGQDPSSVQYVKMKARAAENVGIKFRPANFPFDITTEKLIEEIKKINQEPNMCGLIVQLPLPPHISKQMVLDAIDPKIDVDCIGTVNQNFFYSGNAYMRYPTCEAVMKILDENVPHQKNKKYLVVGFGQLVGKPVSYILEQRGFKVDVARSTTENILDLMKQADVIISAVGKAKLISGEKIKPGAVVIDAGTSESNGAVVGDVDFESVSPIAGLVSPVPGGVGPITVAMLLENVLKVAKGYKDIRI